jgi:hypothetical protein
VGQLNGNRLNQPQLIQDQFNHVSLPSHPPSQF